VEVLKMNNIAAEFARRNAAKAAAVPAVVPVKVCIGCGKELRAVTCWRDREGPFCFDCWEKS
jgi:hypothetical protein